MEFINIGLNKNTVVDYHYHYYLLFTIFNGEY